MLYNNICKNPPTTERPVRASLTPYDTAAPLVLVDEALEPVAVPVPERPVASAVVLQTHTPWMVLPHSDLKPVQSIWAVD